MNKVLIIENSSTDYDKIIGAVPGYDFLPAKCDFDKTKTAIQTSLTSACECITDLIKPNYTDLKCIICDLKLGSVEGKNIIEHIRKKIFIDDYPAFNKFVPIIVYTNYPDNSEEALKAGGNVVLRKNVSKDYLKCVVERQIEDFSTLCDEFILNKPYKVGITFCGKDARPFVKELANSLAIEFSKNKVFFDEFHEEKLKRLSADDVLDKIYTQQSEYVVVFMSKNYQKNHWTGNVEWEAIKNKLIPIRKDSIIPVLFDENARVNGIDFRKDIAIKVPQAYPQKPLEPKDVANLIVKIIEKKGSV